MIQKCIIKPELRFEGSKECLQNNEITRIFKQRFKSILRLLK